jgi:integrase/recombinase XerC
MRRALTDEQVRALIEAARWRRHSHARRDHLALVLLTTYGMRPGELVRISVEDCHVEDRRHCAPAPWLRIRRLKKRKLRGVIDDLPLTEPIAQLVRMYLRQRQAKATVRELGGSAVGAPVELEGRLVGLEPSARLFPITVRSLENVFHYYRGRAKLPDSFTLYALRHTAATRVYRATGSLRMVQEILGHARAETSAHYTHLDPEAMRQAVESVAII